MATLSFSTRATVLNAIEQMIARPDDLATFRDTRPTLLEVGSTAVTIRDFTAAVIAWNRRWQSERPAMRTKTAALTFTRQCARIAAIVECYAGVVR